jgi:hypothetical protein
MCAQQQSHHKAFRKGSHEIIPDTSYVKSEFYDEFGRRSSRRYMIGGADQRVEGYSAWIAPGCGIATIYRMEATDWFPKCATANGSENQTQERPLTTHSPNVHNGRNSLSSSHMAPSSERRFNGRLRSFLRTLRWAFNRRLRPR